MLATLESGREAARRHQWGEALEGLTAADAVHSLEPDDLLLLADAAWWSGDPDGAVVAFERAYAGYEAAGRVGEAAVVGARLAYLAMRRMALSIAMGWIARIERLLVGQPESLGHAWLKILHLARALLIDGDFDAAANLADEAIELGRRHGSTGVQATAMSFKGYVLTHRGDWREGLALIDEASALATSEVEDLRAASDVYCNTIAVCRNLADYRRAGEWTEAAERWMRANSVGGYPGVCQIHRAELKRLHGSWSEAEQEARNACLELERFRLMDDMGFAHHEIGEVRRRMGDLDAAEESFLRSFEYGWEPQPGRALLMLERGDPDGAAESIAASLSRIGPGNGDIGSDNILARARLLSAQVEISLAVGDIETAEAAAEGLERVADIYESDAWRAGALSASGAIHLAKGDAHAAAQELDRAWRLWQAIDLPYEAASTRALLGRARAALGDAGSAKLEFGAARSAFRRLGAEADLRRLNEEMGGDGGAAHAAGTSVTRALMFTDLVTSTDLVGLIGDGAWEELLRWHDRTLRAVFVDHRGEEVKHTGDGFFVAFEHARHALDCAVAVQRRLEGHRREHGFAPWVRIGAHFAEVYRQGADYSGQGVHVAARIGALGDREEIVVSTQLLLAAGVIPFPTSEARGVKLKGVSEPVEVQTVDWR
jgi:class 3 adenylate cyclase